MKKVVQIRGANAVGKTTAIRMFLARGVFEIVPIKIGAKEVECNWDEKRGIFVIGRYDKCVSGGVDSAIKSREELLNTIAKAIREYKPETLLFEGILYGLTFKFAFDLSVFLKGVGYEYVGIGLFPPLGVAFDWLSERNGGKRVNETHIQQKWYSALKSIKKLKDAGLNVRVVDSSKIRLEDMWKIIEDAI